MAAAPIRCRARPGLHICLRSWGSEHVILDTISGDTHLLRDEAIELLREVVGTDLDPGPVVAARLAVRGGPGHQVLGVAEREALILELGRLGLVEIVAS